MNPPDPTPEDIVEETRRLLGAATPGPWEVRGDERRAGVYTACEQHHMCERTGRTIIAKVGQVGTDPLPDAELIAASPRLLSALVAEVERLRNSYQMMLEVHRHCAQLREERDRLRGALQAGWTLGQYEWAQKHSDELRQEGET
jgi:hypothetical protein